jgi:hypothetical protein
MVKIPRGGIFGPDESGNRFLFTGSGCLFRTVDAETVTAFANFVFLVVVSFPCRFDLLFANLYVYIICCVYFIVGINIIY